MLSIVRLIEPALLAVGLENPPRFQVAQATDIVSRQSPELNVDTPTLVIGATPDTLAALQPVLLNAYRPQHAVSLVSVTEVGGERVWEGALGELATAFDRHAERSEASRLASRGSSPAAPPTGTSQSDSRNVMGYVLFVPQLPYPGAVTALEGVMATLLAPHGCPWDREQTHLTLRKYLLEETYEVLDALDKEDMPKLSEELGDLLLQVIFHAQIAVRDGEFRLAEVVNHIVTKLIRRHPHVFGEVKVANADEVTLNWERLKAQERATAGERAADPFAGISLALPALSRAQEMQRRAERFGFKWPDRASAWAKFEEEMAEWQSATTTEEAQLEFGDVLSTLANVGRWDGLDAESALREANTRFTHRFTRLLAQCEADGVQPNALTPAEWLMRWSQREAS